MFIHLDKEELVGPLREGLARELPDTVCAPVSKERLSFLRSVTPVHQVVAVPLDSSTTAVVETNMSLRSAAKESDAALNGVVSALRELVPPKVRG